MWAQQRGEDGRGTWHVVRDTERVERRVGRGRVEVNGNVEVFEGGCQERVRKDGDEVLCAERAVVSAGMD